MSNKFTDGLVNLVNKLANNRSGSTVNKFKPSRLEREQLRAIYKTGIGNKIVRLKAGMAFDDTLVFESKTDGDYWHDVAERKAIDAVQGMLSYGRGIVVIHHKGDDLAKPLGKVDQQSVILSEFTGDIVTVGNVSRDLQGGHYLKPLTYTVEGHQVHHSRVVDFRYVKPPEREAALYLYGGISEFELIVEQLVNDGIIERASSAIVDKSSTFVYKVAGFKDALRAGNDDELIDYFTQLENLRSIHGGLVIDNEDDATSVSQALTNLSEINEMSLRRIALVTGIPVSYLIGEAVRGLNATGESERNALIDTIQQLQKLFLTPPVWELCDKLGLGARRWADDQGITDSDRANYEATILDNALKLWQMGEDANKYLSDKGLADEFDADDFWKPSETVASEPSAAVNAVSGEPEEEHNIDPKMSLNGAQVTAMLSVIEQVETGAMKKATAIKVMASSFPVSEAEAANLLADVSEGSRAQSNLKDPTTPKPDPFQDALTDALNRVTATTTKD